MMTEGNLRKFDKQVAKATEKIKKPKVTHHGKFPIGERGQAIGHCCGNGCIDCKFWCRDAS